MVRYWIAAAVLLLACTLPAQEPIPAPREIKQPVGIEAKGTGDKEKPPSAKDLWEAGSEIAVHSKVAKDCKYFHKGQPVRWEDLKDNWEVEGVTIRHGKVIEVRFEDAEVEEGLGKK